MMKKMALFGILGLVGVSSLALVFGWDRVSLYGETGARMVKEKVEALEGLQTKLELLRTKVGHLDEEVMRLHEGTIRRKISLDVLKDEVVLKESELDRQRGLLERIAGLLASPQEAYKIGGNFYSYEDVSTDAEERFRLFKIGEETFTAMKETAKVQQEAYRATREHLEKSEVQRRAIVAQVSELEAKIAKYEAKQSLVAIIDGIQFPDGAASEIAEAQRLADKISQELEVKNRMLDERVALVRMQKGLIEYDEDALKPTGDVSRRINNYFNGSMETESIELEEIEMSTVRSE